MLEQDGTGINRISDRTELNAVTRGLQVKLLLKEFKRMQ